MVKKIVVACVLMMAAGSTVHAENVFASNTFIGLEIESTKTEGSEQILNLPPRNFNSDSVLEYGFRVGAENDEWRTTALYTYYNDDNNGVEETMNKASLLLDYFFWKTSADAMTIKPYIGAHVGYMTYKLVDTQPIPPGANTTIADTDGIFYGGQVGIDVTISEVIGLDISYKYSLTGMDFTSAPNTTFALDNMGSIAFSINYFY